MVYEVYEVVERARPGGLAVDMWRVGASRARPLGSPRTGVALRRRVWASGWWGTVRWGWNASGSAAVRARLVRLAQPSSLSI